MSFIKPTVGRVVWFHPDPASQVVLSAQIAHVNEDGTLNIGYLNKYGAHASATDVPLCQAGDEAPNGPYCEWMPYQLGQAAKTERAESDLDEARRMASAGDSLIGAGLGGGGGAGPGAAGGGGYSGYGTGGANNEGGNQS